MQCRARFFCPAILGEGTLAGPFTPVVLAVIAAATTGVVVAGVVTGPTIVRCIERGDFNQCISEAYFGAQPAVVADIPPAAAEPAAVAEPAPEPEPEAAPEPQEQAAVEAGPAPTFTVVRVEPDGSAVIAGSGAPSSEIQIFANEELLGSEATDTSGDFAYVTEQPLPLGGVELRLLDVASDQFATTSVVVIVADDRTSEPLVVASEPGEASSILQGLEAAPAETVADAVDVAEQPEAEEAAESAETPAAVADVTTEAPAASVEEPVATEVIEQAAVETEQPAADADVDVAESADPAAIADIPAAVEDAATEVAAAVEANVAEAVEEIAAVAQPAVTEAPAAVMALVPPTIDAVEIDGDRNFFAGGGTEGSAVRLYVENQPVGTADVEDGRWLIETGNVLTAETQRIRVDMLNADGTVASRAEVDFVIDLPAIATETEEQSVVVAETLAQPEVTTQPQPTAAVEPAPASEVVTPEAVTTAPEPVAETEPVVVAQPESDTTTAPVEEVAPAVVPTMVGTTSGNRTTSGHVIIRRGDNLWTIARRVYGEGLRYTQIYQANANQIRNPDLIYPGQVFDLPGTDIVIGEEQ